MGLPLTKFHSSFLGIISGPYGMSGAAADPFALTVMRSIFASFLMRRRYGAHSGQ